jgi:hypothetical protein
MAESAAPLWRSRWVPVGFGAVAAGLVPWLVVLYSTLPGTADAQHWSLAWTGFDCLMAAGLASTTGALALVDAWFDVMTALPGRELAEAVLLAVCAELPLAVMCASIAVSVHRSLTCAASSVTATVTPLRAKTVTVESAAA